MEFDGLIQVGSTHTTTDNTTVYGSDFVVKDKYGNTIPNCFATIPSEKQYHQYKADENDSLIIEDNDMVIDIITDKDLVVEYTGKRD